MIATQARHFTYITMQIYNPGTVTMYSIYFVRIVLVYGISTGNTRYLQLEGRHSSLINSVM